MCMLSCTVPTLMWPLSSSRRWFAWSRVRRREVARSAAACRHIARRVTHPSGPHAMCTPSWLPDPQIGAPPNEMP
jgi:hypothetical protein